MRNKCDAHCKIVHLDRRKSEKGCIGLHYDSSDVLFLWRRWRGGGVDAFSAFM